jgi:hypothetical protein
MKSHKFLETRDIKRPHSLMEGELQVSGNLKISHSLLEEEFQVSGNETLRNHIV